MMKKSVLWSMLRCMNIFEIFKLKKIQLSPDHPITDELLRYACRAEKADFLADLIKQGFNPAEQHDRGSSLIRACIQSLPWSFDRFWLDRVRDKDIDSSRSREAIKRIHLLAQMALNGCQAIVMKSTMPVGHF